MATVHESVERILHALETRSESEYWHGLPEERRVLFAHVDEAFAALGPRLGHPSPKARRYLARLLRDLDRSRAATLLFPLLEDPDDSVRFEACGAVIGEAPLHPQRTAEPPPAVDPDTRPALVAAARTFLRGRLPYAVSDALRWLEHVGDPELAAFLVTLVLEPDTGHRNALCAAIGRAADGGDLLAGLARHPDAEVRAAACLAIGRAATTDRALVVETIVIALDDPDPRVRASATSAAGRLGIHEAEETLLRLANAGSTDALEALATLRSDRGSTLLLAAAARDEPGRLRAIAALTCYPPSDDIERVLLGILAVSEEVFVRAAVVSTLAIVGGPAAIEPVAAFLRRDVHALRKRERKTMLRTLPPTLARWRSIARAGSSESPPS